MDDIFYMKQALRLAAKAAGHTSPNPLVGCVVVKKNRIISSAYHKKAGMLHAERKALLKAGKRARGSVLYVNLEPCNHHGRTAPCTDIIIESGVKKVVCAIKDPHSLVNGKGFNRLRNAGCGVRNGILTKEAEELNKVFIKNVKKKLPYVVIKAGMSTDGKIALKNGKSKWITSEKSRNHAQALRKELDAILVGINTVIKDNPRLDCRADKRKKIKKVVLDYKGRIPLGAKLFRNSAPEDVFIFTKTMKKPKINTLTKRGVNIIISKGAGGIIDGKAVLKELFKRGIMSVLIEGGSRVATYFISKKLVDEAYFYLAPKIIGSEGLNYFGKMHFKDLKKVFSLKETKVIKIGNDMLLKGKVVYN